MWGNYTDVYVKMADQNKNPGARMERIMRLSFDSFIEKSIHIANFSSFLETSWYFGEAQRNLKDEVRYGISYLVDQKDEWNNASYLNHKILLNCNLYDCFKIILNLFPSFIYLFSYLHWRRSPHLVKKVFISSQF